MEQFYKDCWQITRSTLHSVFVMPNGAITPIRITIPPFDSALEIVLITDVKCITKQQYSSDLWPSSLKPSEIVLLTNRSKLVN
jgi:hypothetical protein